MGIVDVNRFNRALASPHWTDDQREEAEDLLEEVEDELAGLLNAPISLMAARVEEAPILDSGLLLTRHPVGASTSITSLDGTVVTGGVLPAGWALEREGLLRRSSVTESSPPPYPGPALTRIQHYAYTVGMVSVTYQPGWGARPALRQAIIRVAKARFLNQHDDTVTARGLDANVPPPLPETWTEDELNKLNWFCWLTTWR